VRILAVVVLSLLVSSLAQAQTPSSKPPETSQPAPKQGAPETASEAPSGSPAVDPAKAADIRRLLDVVGSKSLMTELMSNLMTNMRPMLTSSLPPGDYRERLIDLFLEKFSARASDEFPKLLEAAIPIYDRYLSDEDIKALIQFYQTPLGQKTISTLPKIFSEMQTQGQKLGEQIGRETMLQVLSEHPELVKAMEESQAAPKQAK
jgi:hypothetical protein